MARLGDLFSEGCGVATSFTHRGVCYMAVHGKGESGGCGVGTVGYCGGTGLQRILKHALKFLG